MGACSVLDEGVDTGLMAHRVEGLCEVYRDEIADGPFLIHGLEDVVPCLY